MDDGTWKAWHRHYHKTARVKALRAAEKAELKRGSRSFLYILLHGDAMTGEEAGQRATTSWDLPLVKRRNNLIECKIALRADECENLPRMLLQGRSTPSARHRFVSPVFAKALHPPDRRTGADLELFRRPTSRSSSFHEVYDARSQLTRIRSMHWLALRRINALDSLFRCVLGIPIYSGRDVLVARLRQADGTQEILLADLRPAGDRSDHGPAAPLQLGRGRGRARALRHLPSGLRLRRRQLWLEGSPLAQGAG